MTQSPREQADSKFKAQVRSHTKRDTKMDRDGRLITLEPRKDKVMRSFWDNVDQDGLKLALSESEDIKVQNLLELLTEPKFAHYSFATICRKAGVTLQQLNELWRKHNLALGIAKMSSHLPQVMEDTAVDAKSTFILCPRCDGVGTITRSLRSSATGDFTDVEDTCPQCKGAKEIRQVGDKDARSLTLETMGLIKKGGPTTAVQVNVGEASFEDTMISAQKLLQKPRQADITVEAEEEK